MISPEIMSEPSSTGAYRCVAVEEGHTSSAPFRGPVSRLDSVTGNSVNQNADATLRRYSMKKKSTKSALWMSFTSLLLCVAMLIGCTFAWFTDSVTSPRIRGGDPGLWLGNDVNENFSPHTRG